MAEEKARLESFTKRGEPRAVPDTERPPLAPGGEARVSKDLIRAQERMGAWGGSAITPKHPYVDIKSYVDNAMWVLEGSFKAPEPDNEKREDILALLEAAEEEKKGSEKGQISQLRRRVDAKLTCIEFFYTQWRGNTEGEGEEKGAHKGMRTMKAATKVDDAQIFSRLLQIPEVARGFAELIKTAGEIDPATGLRVRAMFSWNSMQSLLSKLADKGKYESGASGSLYAWMLYEISGMHVEADDIPLIQGQKAPGFPEAKPGMIANRFDSPTLKTIAHINGMLPYEKGTRVEEEWHQYWKKEALLYEAFSIDPTDEQVAVNLSKGIATPGAREVGGGRDKRTGKRATHGDVMYMGNFLCAPGGIVNWDIQEQGVKDKIHQNQIALEREEQDFPRGVDELVGIDWKQVYLEPGKGLHPEAYKRYRALRTYAEETYLWWLDQVLGIVEKENLLQGGNLAVIENGAKNPNVYASWQGKKRQEAELAALMSEVLWVHNAPEIREQYRDKNLVNKIIIPWSNMGGDALKNLELYGRGFSLNEIKESPMTPWQAAFILRRLYDSKDLITTDDGKTFTFEEILNQAVLNKSEIIGMSIVARNPGFLKDKEKEWDNRNWEWCARHSGNPGQTFVEYLREVDKKAREIDGDLHDGKITEEEAEKGARGVGATKNLLRWSFSAEERKEIFKNEGADYRLKFLADNFSNSVIGYFVFQKQFFEYLIKRAINYDQSDEQTIYGKHKLLEQIYGQVLLRLRKFTTDGSGDHFQEYLTAGPRLIKPGYDYAGSPDLFLQLYKPPEKEDRTNACLWISPDMFRPIEIMMMKLSEGYARGAEEYWHDPEQPGKELYPWEAIGSVEDRDFFLWYIATKDQNFSSVFGEEYMTEFRKRFHCEFWDVLRHKALRRILILKPPVGFKEEEKDGGEKKTKGILSKFPYVGPVLAVLPWPRSISEWFLAPAAFNIATRVVSLAGKLIPAIPALSINPLFGWEGLTLMIPLLEKTAVFFQPSLPYILGIYLLRIPVIGVVPILRWLARLADKNPVLRKIFGCRQTRIDLNRRWQETMNVT